MDPRQQNPGNAQAAFILHHLVLQQQQQQQQQQQPQQQQFQLIPAPQPQLQFPMTATLTMQNVPASAARIFPDRERHIKRRTKTGIFFHDRC